MKLTVDNLDSITGWSVSSTKAIVYGLNDIPEFIAGLNNHSLIFKFNALSSGEYVQKSISQNLSKYQKIVFHIWSRNKKYNGSEYLHASDFSYKIDFGTGVEYYIPTYRNLNDITIDISGIGTISRIRITCLHNDEDYIIVSNLIASTDELPPDIFQGIKEQLEYNTNKFYANIENGVVNKGILLGTINALINDKSIILSSPFLYIEKYAVIKIDDGTNSEIHQIDKNDESQFFFNTLYDGKKLLHNYTNANVYLTFQTQFGATEKEVLIPGMTIWGLESEESPMNTKIELERDTFKSSGSVREGYAAVNFIHPVQINCIARHNSLLACMGQIVKNTIAQEYIWVNGKKINIAQAEGSVEVPVVEGYNELPQIDYRINVQVREDVFDKSTEAIMTTRTINYVVI